MKWRKRAEKSASGGAVTSDAELTASEWDRGLGLVIRELELMLAEKRTALSVLRTGIAVFALPLSVLSILIATSRWYDAIHVIGLLVALLLLCAALTFLGVFLVVRAVRRIHAFDIKVAAIKARHRQIASFLE